MHCKSLVLAILTSLLAAGCASQAQIKHNQELGLAAAKESPTARAEILNRCMDMPFQLNNGNVGSFDQGALAALNVPDEDMHAALCHRLVYGLVSGVITFDDMNKMTGDHVYTPAMLKVLKTPSPTEPKFPKVHA